MAGSAFLEDLPPWCRKVASGAPRRLAENWLHPVFIHVLGYVYIFGPKPMPAFDMYPAFGSNACEDARACRMQQAGCARDKASTAALQELDDAWGRFISRQCPLRIG